MADIFYLLDSVWWFNVRFHFIKRIFVKLIYLISRVFLAWTFLIFWPTVQLKVRDQIRTFLRLTHHTITHWSEKSVILGSHNVCLKLITKVIVQPLVHSGPEYLKMSRPKKLVKSHKLISRIFFLPNSIFLPFQKWPKINFWTGKKFKTAKNVISR